MRGVLVSGRGGRLQIWDHPKVRSRYSIGADVATGKVRDRTRSARAELYSYSNQRPDYSAVIIVEVETGLHVASWHGYIQPTEFYPVLAALGYYYNNALIVPEINGPGLAVVEGLTLKLQYPNVYRSKVWNKPDSDMMGGDWGWRTSQNTRPILIARVDESVNQEILFTRDKDLIRELRTMQIDETGIPRAKGKDKDDRVFALGLALQGRFELLYGTLNQEEQASHLSQADQQVWDQIKKQQEASSRGRSASSSNRPVYRRFARGRVAHR
jgi:hypothetical protein